MDRITALQTISKFRVLLKRFTMVAAGIVPGDEASILAALDKFGPVMALIAHEHPDLSGPIDMLLNARTRPIYNRETEVDGPL